MVATIAIIKNVSQMGIVYLFEESELFLHDICEIELQRCVQHSPLHRAARTSNSSFSSDDFVA